MPNLKEKFRDFFTFMDKLWNSCYRNESYLESLVKKIVDIF